MMDSLFRLSRFPIARRMCVGAAFRHVRNSHPIDTLPTTFLNRIRAAKSWATQSDIGLIESVFASDIICSLLARPSNRFSVTDHNQCASKPTPLRDSVPTPFAVPACIELRRHWSDADDFCCADLKLFGIECILSLGFQTVVETPNELI